jgi:hypothetical protein
MGKASNRKKTLSREQRKQPGYQELRYQKDMENLDKIIAQRNNRTPEQIKQDQFKAQTLLTMLNTFSHI